MKLNRFTITVICGFILILLIINYFARNTYKREFLYFYNSTIEGKLDNVGYRRGVTDFIVNGKKFRFVPNYVTENRSFSKIAKIGDSIYKIAYTDTLKLIQNKKTFLYTFKKF